MGSNANVIELSAHRKAKTPPQQPLPQEPWHANEALWILQEANGLTDPVFLNEWEIRFLMSISTWPDTLTPKQERCLKAIGDRMEAAIKVEQQQQPPPPPTSPPAA
jgi:hypothetical protein